MESRAQRRPFQSIPSGDIRNLSLKTAPTSASKVTSLRHSSALFFASAINWMRCSAISSSASASSAVRSATSPTSANTSWSILVSCCENSSLPCSLNIYIARLRSIRATRRLASWSSPRLFAQTWIGWATKSQFFTTWISWITIGAKIASDWSASTATRSFSTRASIFSSSLSRNSCASTSYESTRSAIRTGQYSSPMSVADSTVAVTAATSSFEARLSRVALIIWR